MLSRFLIQVPLEALLTEPNKLLGRLGSEWFVPFQNHPRVRPALHRTWEERFGLLSIEQKIFLATFDGLIEVLTSSKNQTETSSWCSDEYLTYVHLPASLWNSLTISDQ